MANPFLMLANACLDQCFSTGGPWSSFGGLQLNCFIFDLVSSFIQNTNKEFLKVDQYTTIRLIKHETLFHF